MQVVKSVAFMSVIVRDVQFSNQNDMNNKKQGPWKLYESDESSFEWCAHIF